MGRPLSRRGSYSNVVEHVLGSSDATAQPGYSQVIFFLTLCVYPPSLAEWRLGGPALAVSWLRCKPAAEADVAVGSFNAANGG
jgi:hypothetical protein